MGFFKLMTAEVNAAGERALSLKAKPFKMSSPVKVSLKFKSPSHADLAELIPGGSRLDGTTLEWTRENLVSFYPTFMGQIYLSMLKQFIP